MWVWKAVEVDGTSEKEIGKEKNGGRRYAVKDVWLDKNSHTEGDNLNKIFAALNDVDVDHYKWDASVNMMNGESLKSIINRVLHSKQYNQYIMGIKCDQRGKLTKEHAHGADPDPKIFNTELMQESLTETEKIQLTVSSNYSGRAGNTPLPTAHLPSCDYKAKFQYWLVYEDVGKPLDKTPNLKSFSKGIHDACIGASYGCSMDD